MIAKAKTGVGFGGLARYLEHGEKDQPHPERVEWMEARNLPTHDPKTAARIMRATANDNDRCRKPVYHLSISFDVGDRVDSQVIRQVVDQTLQDLGLAEHQALLVAHSDTDHRHVHVMINRIHPETGKAWDNGQDFARIERSLRQQERALGLREVPGHHHHLPGQRAPDRSEALSTGQLRRMERTGELPFAELVKETAAQDLREARGWGELEQRLAAHGLRLERRGRGLVLTDGQEEAKASSIDRKASLAALEKRLGESYDQHVARAHRLDHGPADRSPSRTDGYDPGRDERGPDRDIEGGRDGRRPVRAGGQEGPIPQPSKQRRPDGRVPADGRDRRDGRGRPGLAGEHLDRCGSPDGLLEAFGALEKRETLEIRAKDLDRTAKAIRDNLHPLERRVEWLKRLNDEFDRKLTEVYERPGTARVAFESFADDKGHGKAAWRLQNRPEQFGGLKGWRFGPFASSERRKAEKALKRLGAEARKLNGARKAVELESAKRSELYSRRDYADQAIKQARADLAQKPQNLDLMRAIAQEGRGLSNEDYQRLTTKQRQQLAKARETVKVQQKQRPRGLQR